MILSIGFEGDNIFFLIKLLRMLIENVQHIINID